MNLSNCHYFNRLRFIIPLSPVISQNKSRDFEVNFDWVACLAIPFIIKRLHGNNDVLGA